MRAILLIACCLPAFCSGPLLAQDPSSSSYHTVFLPAHDAGDTRAPNQSQSWGAFSIAAAEEGAISLTGWAINHGTEADASDAALEMCSRRGGKECEVDLVFVNQCASVATSATETAASRDRTLRRARRSAMQACGSDCRVLYEGCTVER
ncbi:DUF4189 domain-containing protein [Luteimonas sp. WGS1318]|uniref:DUF4189 domain-containing protein n=1 Tax=Luteimonas sp. WGS1318 TaxID=3366815 RepID=UPI00372D763C